MSQPSRRLTTHNRRDCNAIQANSSGSRDSHPAASPSVRSGSPFFEGGSMSLSHGTVSAATDNESPARTSRYQHDSRQPPGLLLLCVIEGCERFAATSLSSLLVLYMTEQRGAAVAEALRLVGTFHALCYL